MSGIFKAYDIRGIFPGEINKEMAEYIGRAYVEFTGAKRLWWAAICVPILRISLKVLPKGLPPRVRM